MWWWRCSRICRTPRSSRHRRSRPRSRAYAADSLRTFARIASSWLSTWRFSRSLPRSQAMTERGAHTSLTVTAVDPAVSSSRNRGAAVSTGRGQHRGATPRPPAPARPVYSLDAARGGHFSDCVMPAAIAVAVAIPRATGRYLGAPAGDGQPAPAHRDLIVELLAQLGDVL